MAMELTDQFVVPLAIEDAWALLTDVERIAPCLPGARLDGISDGEFKGVVKVKVGPITVEYKGTARFESLDESSHTLVLKASGRESRGQGNASATVTGELVSEGASTKVDLHTDLQITGKVAQFGRGVLADVSSKLLGQFVKNLENDLIAAGATAAMPTSDPAPVVDGALGDVTQDLTNPDDTVAIPTVSATTPPPPATVRPAEPEPVNLVRLIGGSIGKRVLPAFALLAFASLARRIRRRRRS